MYKEIAQVRGRNDLIRAAQGDHNAFDLGALVRSSLVGISGKQ